MFESLWWLHQRPREMNSFSWEVTGHSSRTSWVWKSFCQFTINWCLTLDKQFYFSFFNNVISLIYITLMQQSSVFDIHCCTTLWKTFSPIIFRWLSLCLLGIHLKEYYINKILFPFEKYSVISIWGPINPLGLSNIRYFIVLFKIKQEVFFEYGPYLYSILNIIKRA